MDKRRLLIIALCSFATAPCLHFTSGRLASSSGITATTTKPGGVISATARSLRPNFPYSVIPGGAYSPAELRYANHRDHLVREHYADFDLSSARLVTLTDDRYQYVSFRLRDRIYWTRNKLRIPRGEVLLTDGRNYARTRCGNRLSSKPKPNTTAQQPSERLLSLPPFSPGQLKKGEVKLAPAPPIGELAQAYPELPFDLPRLAPYVPAESPVSVAAPPQIWPPIGTYPPPIPIVPGYVPIAGPGGPTVLPISGPPVTPVTAVPEPTGLVLFTLALFSIGWPLLRILRDKTAHD